MTTNAVEACSSARPRSPREVALERGAVGESGEEVVMGLELQMAVHQTAGDGGGELVGDRSEATEVGGGERLECTLSSADDEYSRPRPAPTARAPHTIHRHDRRRVSVVDAVQDRVPSWVVGASRESVEWHTGRDGHQRDLAVEDDETGLAGPEQSCRLVDASPARFPRGRPRRRCARRSPGSTRRRAASGRSCLAAGRRSREWRSARSRRATATVSPARGQG